MNITDVLARAAGRPDRKRCGRGRGSGLGKTSGRGQKGAKSRSGWKRRYGYEGGQMPLVRRVPKRGFLNALFRVRYDVINVADLELHFEAGSVVRLSDIAERGLMKPRHGRLKVLGGGELTKSLTVVADAVSAAARGKVEAKGGKIELVGGPKKPKPAGRPKEGAAAQPKSQGEAKRSK